MPEHLIFITYIILFIISTIGHGEIFSRIIYKDLIKLNIGYLGIIGFFSLSIYATLSSYFFAHNYFHNIILHIIGLLGFIFYLNREKKNFHEVKNLFILTLIF